jgi:hypothetical protein
MARNSFQKGFRNIKMILLRDALEEGLKRHVHNFSNENPSKRCKEICTEVFRRMKGPCTEDLGLRHGFWY